MPVADAKKTIWKDPLTRETFIIDNRTGSSYPQSTAFPVDADGPIEATSKRRTLRAPQLTAEENNHSKSNTDGDHMPIWLREALQVCFLPPHRVLDHVTEIIERPTTPSRLKNQRYPPSPYR